MLRFKQSGQLGSPLSVLMNSAIYGAYMRSICRVRKAEMLEHILSDGRETAWSALATTDLSGLQNHATLLTRLSEPGVQTGSPQFMEALVHYWRNHRHHDLTSDIMLAIVMHAYSSKHHGKQRVMRVWQYVVDVMPSSYNAEVCTAVYRLLYQFYTDGPYIPEDIREIVPDIRDAKLAEALERLQRLSGAHGLHAISFKNYRGTTDGATLLHALYGLSLYALASRSDELTNAIAAFKTICRTSEIDTVAALTMYIGFLSGSEGLTFIAPMEAYDDPVLLQFKKAYKRLAANEV